MLGRSIFAKYFFACASVLVFSFLALATAMIGFSVRYSVSQRESMYLKSAGNIAAQTLSYYSAVANFAQSGSSSGSFSFGSSSSGSSSSKSSSSGSASSGSASSGDSGNLGRYESAYLSSLKNQLFYSYQLSAYNLEARILIFDANGQMQGAFDERQQSPVSMDIRLPSAVLKLAKVSGGGGFADSGTLGGLFTSQHTSAVVPITDPSGTLYGIVVVSSLTGNTLHMVSGMLRVFLLCLILVLLLAFIAVWFVSMRMVRPLRQMSAAAKSFAKGDFSVRVPVRDQDEIGQLAVAFNNMAASLTSLEEMRRSFVANVSHELKTPMTSIAGFIDGILDGTIPREKETDYLRLVSDEVKRLSRLVRSFLDIARIEAGELKFTPVEFDLMELTRRVIVGFEQTINEKRLEVRGLDSDSAVPVRADRDLTHQIVYNLVDNAVKFANEGGYLEINVAPHGKKVFMGVKNSGMGISTADLPYVFDRFYKTDKSRSRDRKGVGLGLYIVKTVLNMQGEDIAVKSVEGDYCEFVFSLPQA